MLTVRLTTNGYQPIAHQIFLLDRGRFLIRCRRALNSGAFRYRLRLGGIPNHVLDLLDERREYPPRNLRISPVESHLLTQSAANTRQNIFSEDPTVRKNDSSFFQFGPELVEPTRNLCFQEYLPEH